MHVIQMKWLVRILMCLTCPNCVLADEGAESDRQKREYLKTILYSREAIDNWLKGDIVWGELYHPTLGWIHNERTIQHGTNDSFVSYHYDADGARRVMAYAGQPCRVQALATEHGLTATIDSPESLGAAVESLFTGAGLYASMRIVEKVEAFAEQHRKEVLYVLSYGNKAFRSSERSGKRFDQTFIDFMNAKKLPYVDLLQAHLQDFSEHKLDVDRYVKRYWIGHYTPSGNFFAANNIKDPLVTILNPRPLSYNPTGKVTFESPWEGGKDKVGR